jgi:hypothetical protein
VIIPIRLAFDTPSREQGRSPSAVRRFRGVSIMLNHPGRLDPGWEDSAFPQVGVI